MLVPKWKVLVKQRIKALEEERGELLGGVTTKQPGTRNSPGSPGRVAELELINKHLLAECADYAKEVKALRQEVKAGRLDEHKERNQRWCGKNRPHGVPCSEVHGMCDACVRLDDERLANTKEAKP